MQRVSTITVVTAALGLILVGCGNDEPAAAERSGTSTATGIEAAVSSAASALPDSASVDDMKAAGFVIAFRNGFPGLADGRSDDDIKRLLSDTCADIHGGKSDTDVRSALAERAAHGGFKPSEFETTGLYESIRMLC